MGKHSGHKHSGHKHSGHQHSGHQHSRQYDDGQQGGSTPKATAAQTSGNVVVAASAVTQWSNPIPDPEGGPFSWQFRRTAKGDLQWQVVGSKAIDTPQMGVQPHTTNPAQLSNYPYAAYGPYTTGTNPMQAMTMAAQQPYQGMTMVAQQPYQGMTMVAQQPYQGMTMVAQQPYQGMTMTAQQPYQAQTGAGPTGIKTALAGYTTSSGNKKTVTFETPKTVDSRGRSHSRKRRGRRERSERRMSSGEKVSQWLTKPKDHRHGDYVDDDYDDYDDYDE